MTVRPTRNHPTGSGMPSHSAMLVQKLWQDQQKVNSDA